MSFPDYIGVSDTDSPIVADRVSIYSNIQYTQRT